MLESGELILLLIEIHQHTSIYVTIKCLTIAAGARVRVDKMVSWRVNVAQEVGGNKNRRDTEGKRHGACVSQEPADTLHTSVLWPVQQDAVAVHRCRLVVQSCCSGYSQAAELQQKPRHSPQNVEQQRHLASTHALQSGGLHQSRL